MASLVDTGYLSSAKAAEMLGVSQHQVAMLAKREEFSSTKVGGTLLIDPYSLQFYLNMREGKGRPWNKAVSWGMLWALSGLDPDWLDPQQVQRLGQRIKTISARELVWQTRRRSHLRVYQADESVFDELRGQIFLSGKSTDRPDIFGMPVNNREIEGYVDAQYLPSYEDAFKLKAATTGNVLIHVYEDQPWPVLAPFKQMPVAVVAADLAASLDPRESHAGIAALEILIGGMRSI